MKYTILFLLVVECTNAAPPKKHCERHGKIRYVVNNTTLERKIGYCEDSDGLRLYSLNWKPQKITHTKIGATTFGHPLFRVCQKNGGKPLAIQYLLKDEWRPQSICIFKNAAFIDVYHLMDQ